MKKTLALVAVVSLLCVAFIAPAEAGKKKSKKMTVKETYETPAWGIMLAGNGGGFCGTGCVTFMPRATDSIVSISIEDATGGDVVASVGQDLDGDNFADNSTEVCTKADNIPVTGGYEVNVFIWVGACTSGANSTPTTGTVTATFSS